LQAGDGKVTTISGYWNMPNDGTDKSFQRGLIRLRKGDDTPLNADTDFLNWNGMHVSPDGITSISRGDFINQSVWGNGFFATALPAGAFYGRDFPFKITIDRRGGNQYVTVNFETFYLTATSKPATVNLGFVAVDVASFYFSGWDAHPCKWTIYKG
jgi:hypothetical protein